MAKAQAELEHKTVNVSAAGGKVKVAANGAGENSRDQDWQTDFGSKRRRIFGRRGVFGDHRPPLQLQRSYFTFVFFVNAHLANT